MESNMKKSIRSCCFFATFFGASLVCVGLSHGKNETFPAGSFFEGEVVLSAAADEVPAGYKVKKVLPHAGLVVLSVEKGAEQRQMRALQARGKKAGLNLRYEAFEVPNDSMYEYQWNMPMVQAEAAWLNSTGEGVTVAVLDTGLKTDGAEDGIGCVTVLAESDIVNSDNDPIDGDGHGTHVSGTIAQKTGNDTGVVGLAYDACIMPVKVLDDMGSGSTADIAEGVSFAVDNGAKVINMSLGMRAQYKITEDPILDPELEKAYNADVTVVCASGNESWRKNVGYPAISEYTIAVGAVDIDGNVASYSNGGTGLDLVAPGGAGLEAGDAILQEAFDDDGWNYFYYTGTSMATPHVAAAAAILYAVKPAISSEEVRDALNDTAMDIGGDGYDADSGWGLLQVYNALLFISGTDVCHDVDGDGYSTCEGEDQDCNDDDPAVNPGNAEVCDDGIDNNCDGNVDEDCQITECVDADGDGYTTCEGEYHDCDDTNFHVHPGHLDTRGRFGSDGVDNDCNSVIDG